MVHLNTSHSRLPHTLMDRLLRSETALAIGTQLRSTPRRLIVGLLLAVSDCAIAAIACLTLHAAWTKLFVAPPALDIGALDCGLSVVCLALFGLYHGLGLGPVERLRARTLALACFFVLRLFVVSLSASTAAAIIPLLTWTGLVLVLGFYAEAAIRHHLIAARLWAAPVVIYGLNATARALAEQLKSDAAVGLMPIAFAASREPDQLKQSSPVAREADLLVLSDLAEPPLLLPHPEAYVVSQPHHRETILAEWPPDRPRPRILLARANAAYDRAQQATCAIGDFALVNAATGTANRRRISWAKRAIDLTIALPLMILALPVLALLALAVKWADPGPAFYTQARVGRNGRTVNILKIRTMYLNSEARLTEYLAESPAARAEWQSFFKLSNDPRIIRMFGGLLRRTSLDELPQLWNVIRGDISLIGPRPFPEYHLNSFDQQFRSLRTSIQPGLTGLWQVSERSNGDLSIQRACDLRYIEHWSPWLDFYILLATPLAVLSGRGAR